MGRMEIITHTERRRRHSEITRATILADADAPGSTVRGAAKRHGVAESLIYHWRSARRRTASIASEPMQFPGLVAKRDSYSRAATDQQPVWSVKSAAAREAGMEIRVVFEIVEQRMELGQ